MKIKITAYGILRSYTGQGDSRTPFEKEISKGKTIAAIINDMGIPDGMVMLVAVNDQQKGFDHIPQDGDDIKIIPPISGG
ncbi:MAG: MoaD/ThiS family protein [Planctomycetota bacterium]|nr:MoaD/ThiS family protein [Planctomycetota bacterium]MDI6786793.1 MoaD/ThiS family protein [Planctomycetota bacterium]